MIRTENDMRKETAEENDSNITDSEDSFEESNEEDQDKEENRNGRKYNIINFGITNARSLWCKLFSMYDAFTELNMSFIVISETWFHDCPALTRIKCDAQTGYGLETIDYMRKPEGRRNRGGGVSIIFKKSRVSLKQFNVKRAGHEIVVASGKFINNTRQLFVIGVYISTRLTVKEVSKFINTVVEIITKIKSEARDPYIVIGGDFNSADPEQILEHFPDLQLASSLPTRGSAALDLLISNINKTIDEVNVRAPLTNSDGSSKSDHALVHFRARLEHQHAFTWKESYYRPMTCAQIRSAVSAITAMDWGKELPDFDSSPDVYVEKFHKVIVGTCERIIPWKKARVRSTDDPWITAGIRKKVRQRKGVYKREGRSRKWRRLKATSSYMTYRARKGFYDRAVKKMKQPGSLPFQAIKKLKDHENPASWSLPDLNPKAELSEILETSADFFSEISAEFTPLSESSMIQTYDKVLAPLSAADVEKGLKEMKKPKSYTSIDIPPDILVGCYHALAVALVPIMNRIREGKWWPKLWKKEEVTIIPKATHPSGLGQTRNISCTTIYSKLAESFMLDELKKEVSLSRQQFGGKKGCEPTFS